MATKRSAAKPRAVDRDPPAAHAPGPTAQQFEAMRRELVALHGKYNELKEATGGVTLLAPEEVPIYEIGEGGYYSADDVLYPAGVQIEDITGTIIPNEQMIPLNAAAERRMAAYLTQLPRGGGAVSAELWIEATAAVLPTFDGSGMSPTERDAELHRLVLQQVNLTRAKEMGLADLTPRLPVRSQRSGPVPMMSNTRIRQGDVFDRGHLAGTAPMPQRGPTHTRVRSQPLAAAQKSAPPMGTVHNDTIGR